MLLFEARLNTTTTDEEPHKNEAGNGDGNENGPSALNRRDVLKSMGAAGIGISGGAASMNSLSGVEFIGDASAASTAPSRTVEIQGSGSTVSYEFSVTGLLIGESTTSEDDVSGGTASGAVKSGSDTYSFSGEFTSFSMDGDATVSVDGEQYNVADFPKHEVSVAGEGGGASYDFGVSGALTPTSTVDDKDTISGFNASGNVGRGYDTYGFTGELTYLDIDGDARVYIDGDGADKNSHLLDKTLPSEIQIDGEFNLTYWGAQATQKTVTEEWHQIDFNRDFGDSPLILADMQTFNGGDPAGLRYKNLTSSGVDIRVEEETSNDSETNHGNESVGYFVFNGATAIRGEGKPPRIGETGRVSVDQPDSSTWRTISLDKSYENPVVLMKPASRNYSDFLHTRLKNVSNESFEFQLEEWDYDDGGHGEETVGYMVMEAGEHTLPDGTTVEVGTTTTDHSSTNVSFSAGFSTTPIVVSQAQTRNGSNAIVTRQSVSSSGFDVQVQEQESKGTHKDETVGYVAISPGTHSFDGARNYGFSVPGGKVLPGEDSDTPAQDTVSDNFANGYMRGQTDNYYYSSDLELFTDYDTIQFNHDAVNQQITVSDEHATPSSGVKYSLKVSGEFTDADSSATVDNSSSGTSTASSTLYQDEDHAFDFTGRLTGFTIEEREQFEVTLRKDVRRGGAVDSKKLQMGAEVDRLDEYEPLANKAKEKGYVRRDPAGIDAARVDTKIQNKVPRRDTIAFNLANVEDASSGTIAHRINRETEEIEVAMLERVHETSDEITSQLERYDATGTSGLSQENIDIDVAAIRESRENAKNYSTAGLLATIISGVGDYTTSFLRSKADEIKKAIETGDLNAAVNARLSFATVNDLADSGIIQGGNAGYVDSCAACQFIASQTCAVVCGRVAPVVACSILGITVAGALSCATIVVVVCEVADEVTGCGEAVADAVCNDSQVDLC